VPTHLPLADVEKTVIAATLRRNEGNVKETAAVLGIDRSTLYDKLKKYAIER
jgi:transcriptional regulator of acetoin/glycerol metabolism